MAFTSQFSLSLELTRLLPLAPAVNAVGGAVGKIAREIQQSGSDFIVEEDLAAVFGRMRVGRQFESTFRTAIQNTETTRISSILDIVLESGAGPTVRRALTATSHDSRYLSTVIQISLLSFVHQKHQLASGLAYVLEQRLLGAPPGTPDAPGYDALLGVICACNEQTANFRWPLIFDAVQLELGPDYEKTFKKTYPNESRDASVTRFNCLTLPYCVLQGLLDMLPAVQSLPEDRIVYIQTVRGVPTIVIWAHTVLGLTVSVKTFGRKAHSVMFGAGQPQILVDVCQSPEIDGAEICLLNEAKERLFHLSEESSTMAPLEATRRLPLSCYGVSIIMSLVRAKNVVLDDRKRSQLLRTIAREALASGIYQLCGFPENLEKLSDQIQRSAFSNWHRVERALSVIFEAPDVKMEEIFETLCNWNEEAQQQEKTRRWYCFDKSVASYTVSAAKKIRVHLLLLAKLIAGFSCIDNIDDCLDLLVPETLSRPGGGLVGSSILKRCRKRKRHWDEPRDGENWDDSTLLKFFGRVLIGPEYQWNDEALSFKRTSLISDWGWSAFLPTFDLIDPSDVSPFQINIRRGVPVRNEVRKRRILDAGTRAEKPKQKGSIREISQTSTNRRDLESASIGETASISGLGQDLSGAKFSKASVGVKNDAFLVSYAINSLWGEALTGFREMYRLPFAGYLHRSGTCDHNATIISELKMPGVYCIEGFGALHPKSNLTDGKSHKFFLVPVSGNIPGRWLSLCHGQRVLEAYTRPVIWLRNEQICQNCLMESVIAETAKDKYYCRPSTVIL